MPLLALRACRKRFQKNYDNLENCRCASQGAENGKHKIRIAIGHNWVTKYLVTRFVVDTPEQLRDGQVVDIPDAPHSYRTLCLCV